MPKRVPIPPFAEVVRAFDTGQPIPSWAGTLFAFLDGSGDDPIVEHEQDAWHTFALVFSNADGLLSQDLRNSFLLPNRQLHKWNGHNPLKPKKNLSRKARQNYRRDFTNAMSSGTCPAIIWVHAWSYQGRHVFRRKARTMEAFGIPRTHPPHAFGWTCDWDKRGRTVTRLHWPPEEKTKERVFLDGNLLVLLQIAQQSVVFQHTVDVILEQRTGERPSGLILVTDPLCGDTVDLAKGDRRHGELLSQLLHFYSNGRINLRAVDQQDSRVGELLADNLAGMLNDAVMKNPEAPSTPGISAISATPNVNLVWQVFHGDGRNLLIQPTNEKTPAVVLPGPEEGTEGFSANAGR